MARGIQRIPEGGRSSIHVDAPISEEVFVNQHCMFLECPMEANPLEEQMARGISPVLCKGRVRNLAWTMARGTFCAQKIIFLNLEYKRIEHSIYEPNQLVAG